VLDDGEQLDVRLIPAAEPSGRAEVEIRMSAMRADDLSRVLTGYSRVLAIMNETSEVSRTARAGGWAVERLGCRNPSVLWDGIRCRVMEGGLGRPL
jgi:hypothetical protein